MDSGIKRKADVAVNAPHANEGMTMCRRISSCPREIVRRRSEAGTAVITPIKVQRFTRKAASKAAPHGLDPSELVRILENTDYFA